MIWKLVLRLLDAQADWIRRISTENEMRIGVVCVDVGLALSLAWPIIAATEPPLVYEMSAWALILTGAGVILTARVHEDQGDPDA